MHRRTDVKGRCPFLSTASKIVLGVKVTVTGKNRAKIRDLLGNMPHSVKLASTTLLLIVALAITRGSDLASSLTTAQAIEFMKSADTAWIFTVYAIGSHGPRLELSKPARRQFVAFISDPDNFGKPLGMPIGPPDVGIEFERGGQKFTIYTNWQFSCFYDNFHRLNFIAVLNLKEMKLAQAWQKQYFPRPVSTAQPAPGN